jgi:hypothetical protein
VFGHISFLLTFVQCKVVGPILNISNTEIGRGFESQFAGEHKEHEVE